MAAYPRFVLLSSVLLATAATASEAGAQTYVYSGNVYTDMAGGSCRANLQSDENWNVSRGPGLGYWVSSNYTGTGLNIVCPLNRRNTSRYGKYVGYEGKEKCISPITCGPVDRVLATSIKVQVYDGSNAQRLSCRAFVGTAQGGSYWSSTRYACSTTNGGCTSAPSTSFQGNTELSWSNPFGTSAISNQGAVNMGVSCTVPKNSNVYFLRGVFSPN